MKFWKYASLAAALAAGSILRICCEAIWNHDNTAAIGTFTLFLFSIGVALAMVSVEEWWQ